MRRAIRELLFLLLLAAGPALLAGWWHPRRPAFSVATMPTLSVASALELGRKHTLLWIDARRESAFVQAHVSGAIRLTEDDWERLLPAVMDAWTPGQPVIVYCDQHTCDTSREVVARLKRELQLENVYVLEGGWQSWTQSAKNDPQ